MHAQISGHDMTHRGTHWRPRVELSSVLLLLITDYRLIDRLCLQIPKTNRSGDAARCDATSASL